MNFKFLFCQVIETISVEFIREYKEDKKTEIIKGIINYQAPSKTFIKVTYPINQWMILNEMEMVIYYPDEKKAFRITTNISNAFSMPFFQAFLGVIKDDFGLSELGYSMYSYKVKDSVLTSCWNPPKNLSKLLGNIILEYTENKIINVELLNPKGKILSRSSYRNHILYGATYFPLEVCTTKNFISCSSIEKIIFKNPLFNSPLPKEVIGFKIPSDISVKEIKW